MKIEDAIQIIENHIEADDLFITAEIYEALQAILNFAKLNIAS